MQPLMLWLSVKWGATKVWWPDSTCVVVTVNCLSFQWRNMSAFDELAVPYSTCYHYGFCCCSTTTCVESRLLEFHFTLYCNSFKAFFSLTTFLTGSRGIFSRPDFPNNFPAYTRLYTAYHWCFVLLFFLTQELSNQVSNYDFKNARWHSCIRKQVFT